MKMNDSAFCNLVDGILTIVGVPFKHGVIEFSDRAPPVFIGYNFYDVPKCHGDGNETATEYFITFDIISEYTAEIDRVYSRLLELLTENDFCRAGGSYSAHSDYPKYYQKSVDFEYCMECENT
jgi:hypothetical protein